MLYPLDAFRIQELFALEQVPGYNGGSETQKIWFIQEPKNLGKRNACGISKAWRDN
jgi:hypothetical protein